MYRLTQDKGVDHILELAGGNDLANALMAVAVGGRISQIGVIDGWELTGDIGLLLRKAAVIQGISVGHTVVRWRISHARLIRCGSNRLSIAVIPFSEGQRRLSVCHRGHLARW